MVKNIHKVPTRIWKSFKSDKAKEVFNSVITQSLPNQNLTCHPKTPTMKDEQWHTICHNFACYAGWAVDKDPLVVKEEVSLTLDTTQRWS